MMHFCSAAAQADLSHIYSLVALLFVLHPQEFLPWPTPRPWGSLPESATNKLTQGCQIMLMQHYGRKHMNKLS